MHVMFHGDWLVQKGANTFLQKQLENAHVHRQGLA